SFVNRIKLPFEPNVLAQAAGLAALGDQEFIARSLDNNRRGMRYLADEFKRLGLNQVPSYANFIMVDFGSEPAVTRLHQALLRQGIAIRPLTAFGLPHCFRVTVGTPDENEAFVTALRKCL
ncbi:MAG TPA: aminotransferase class I/II-fold pyridoxal phosphate-dependent enzyme, partial [Candidatus Obscuribacterales bacterium]